MVGHHLDGPAQRRMIQPAHAVRRARIHQFLRRSRVGQGNAQRLGALQRQVQVLLVQLDPEARIEGPLDHTLPMHLEYAR